ncbi:hypothetical protein BACOVA_02716 [Bacteroides ovatus ATCC 8483]|uniref:Uncharacterized protein n=1 Tax=Bacteroides ovatus (strain ATCC 8483 / DSM 1896 / JCM 5824 / BCRC 10623 / CCUG 4943 / NCTC 11153) TaxID=411476 RepID=A0AAN3A8C8_BACO1|nr:hypothetical protein BACOVA_02716 [Bacteroides ovatus ATCC 8483]
MLFAGTFCCADILKVKSKNSRVLKWYFIMFFIMIIFMVFELKHFQLQRKWFYIDLIM